MKRTLRIVREYPHAPAKVWRALTDRQALAEWLMPNDFEPRVGHRFTLRTEPAPGFDGIVHCEVLTLEEPRRLAFSWKGGPLDTVITFALEPTAGGTRLHVEQTGFTGFKAVLVSFILGSGSKSIYGQKLPAVLDRITDDGRLLPANALLPQACAKGGFWQSLVTLLSPVLKSK